MLMLEQINVSYGKIRALQNISLHVEKGEIVALIGANGAGKTTTLRTISGLLSPVGGVGRIIYDRNVLYDATGESRKTHLMDAHEIVKLGLCHVPEGRCVFPKMTVHENLLMGAYGRKEKFLDDDFSRVFTHFPRLKEREKQLASTLSGGEQQMLAIGRALMAHPKLLLLDEPSMGLAPLLVEEIFHIIEDINLSGTTILLVEQNANLALEISDRAYVLETGEIVLEGDYYHLSNNTEIQEAYLGK